MGNNLDKNIPGGSPDPLETQSSISPEVQAHITQDPRLQKLATSPDNLRAIVDAYEKNKAVLTPSDNQVEQSRIWAEILPGYNEMTSDGRDFSKLAQAEVDALNDQEYDRYQKWKIGNKIAANNQKQEIGTQLDAANNQLSILNSNFEAGKIIEKIHFSDEDKSKINSLLSEAKSGTTDNAAITELKKQGVPDTDIQSGKYDSYISASIIIEHASKFEGAKDPVFRASIRSLQSLGIPVRVQPDFQSVSSHMDARLQSGDRLDTAKSSIRDGLASGQYKNVHYDGIGERYTLIGADGKTQKEIYLDKPPRSSIRLDGIALSRDMPKPNTDDQKRTELIELYKKNGNAMAQIHILPTPPDTEEENTKIKSLYKKIYGEVDSTTQKTPTWEERLSAIEEMKGSIDTRKNKLDAIPKGSVEFDQFEKIGHTIGGLNEEKIGLDKLTTVYKQNQAITKQLTDIPQPKSDTWDEDAQKSLKTLSNLGISHLGQSGFDDFMEAWDHQNKNSKNYQLNLSEKAGIDEGAERALSAWIDRSWTQVGTTRQEKFTNLRNNLKNQEFRSQNWDTPEKRAKYLFGKSENPEQLKKSATS